MPQQDGRRLAAYIAVGVMGVIAVVYGAMYLFAPAQLQRFLHQIGLDGGEPPIIISDSSVDVYISPKTWNESSDGHHHYVKGLSVVSISQGTDDPAPVCSSGAACGTAAGQTVTFRVQGDSTDRLMTILPYTNGSESGTDIMATDPGWKVWSKAKSDRPGYDEWQLPIGNLYNPGGGGPCSNCTYYVCFATSKNCPPGPMKK